MARSKKTQSKHDTEVSRIVKKLEKQDYNVEADLPGYKKPRTFDGYRPDVIGKKGIKRQIHEVETPDSQDSVRDQKQQKAFEQVADRSKNTTFKRTVTE